MATKADLKIRELKVELMGLEVSHNTLTKMVEVLASQVRVLASFHKEELDKLKAEEMKVRSENAQKMQNMQNMNMMGQNRGRMMGNMRGMSNMGGMGFMPQSVKKPQINN